MSSDQAYGGTAAARRNVQCECGHDSGHHEGDEYGFCLVCDCNHYIPVIRSAERKTRDLLAELKDKADEESE